MYIICGMRELEVRGEGSLSQRLRGREGLKVGNFLAVFRFGENESYSR